MAQASERGAAATGLLPLSPNLCVLR